MDRPIHTNLVPLPLALSKMAKMVSLASLGIKANFAMANGDFSIATQGVSS